MTQSKITTEITEDVRRLSIENSNGNFVEVTQIRHTGEFNISSHEGPFMYRGKDVSVAMAVVERTLKDAQ